MRTIEGFSRYKITEDGRIFDTERGRFVSYVYDRDGYRRSTIKNNSGRWRTMAPHRLVAIAYIPNSGGKPCVTFKNDNKDDIRIDNLEWITKREAQMKSLEVN